MLQWTDSLTTGNAEIDQEHRQIFDKLNGIETAIQKGADKECLIRMVTTLLDYTYYHFSHEEHAMNCARCSSHHTNCAAHRLFTMKIRGWLAAIMKGGTSTTLLQEIHQESCAWLMDHIRKVDTGLLQHAAHGGRASVTN
jgi:hemerythrin